MHLIMFHEFKLCLIFKNQTANQLITKLIDWLINLQNKGDISYEQYIRKRAVDKIQYPFLIKTVSKLKKEKNFLCQSKSIYKTLQQTS